MSYPTLKDVGKSMWEREKKNLLPYFRTHDFFLVLLCKKMLDFYLKRF